MNYEQALQSMQYSDNSFVSQQNFDNQMENDSILHQRFDSYVENDSTLLQSFDTQPLVLSNICGTHHPLSLYCVFYLFGSNFG